MTWTKLSAREKDAMIVERVLKWHPDEYNVCEFWGIRRYVENERHWELFRPSTSISDAMLVLEKFPECALLKMEGRWQVRTRTWERDETATDFYDSLPEAICVYALRASGVEIE